MGDASIPASLAGGLSLHALQELGKLVVEMEQGRLRLPEGLPLAGPLREEIAGVQAGTGRGGGHDDLVFALALAVWRAGPATVDGRQYARLF